MYELIDLRTQLSTSPLLVSNLTAVDMVENCLFILWRHLEFYLIHCVPADQGTSLFQLNVRKQRLRRLQGWHPSTFNNKMMYGQPLQAL